LPETTYQVARQILISAARSMKDGDETQAQASATIGIGWALLAIAEALGGIAGSAGGGPGPMVHAPTGPTPGSR
jgi:hypothetical protein